MTLVTCRCAFRLGKLAQNAKTVVAVLVSGILPENSRIKLLLRHVHVPFDCARWYNDPFGTQLKASLWNTAIVA